jgi:CelD/BcsL family acetyltransferase involved in cellulose biosynthesis
VKSAGSDRVVLKRIAYDPVAWDAIAAAHPEAEVFHGAAWLDYLAATQGAEPVIAVVRDAGRPVGYFVGGIVRRYGVRILGSPLRGWATMHMGFLLEEGIDRRAAADALTRFAFDDLGCLHVELGDRWMTREQMADSGYAVESGQTFVVDLASPEEEILSRMRSTTRNYVRQAGRKGLRAEPVTDISFADEYYAQLTEVFARQGLTPTYTVTRVRELIRTVRPGDGLLLMRVRAPDGDSLATAITVGRNDTAVLWGAAFNRAHADCHPNELLHWEAMRYWRSKGILRYDMGGGGDYKAKYGGVEMPTYRFHRSRYRVLRLGRSAIRRMVRVRQVVVGRLARPSERPGTA